MGRKKAGKDQPAEPAEPARQLPPPGRVEVALFLTAFVAYAGTMARGPSWGDSCELALVADTLSIPHPTGYPLYVLLGWFASKLPLGPLAVRVGLLSVVPTALAVVLAYRLALRVTRGRASAAAAALAFAFFQEVWEQALVPEVYGLHLLLATSILLALARLLEEPSERRLLVLAACGGLGFAHHMQTVFLVPGALAGVCLEPRARRLLADPLRVARVLAVGTAPLLLYGLLMVWAHLSPYVDQADARTPGGLLTHMTGRQFAYRMFGDGEGDRAVREVKRLGREVLEQPAPWLPLAVPVLAIAALGAIALANARTSRALPAALAVSAATCVAYTLNYHIPDKSAYYLTLHLGVALSLAAGLDALRALVPAGVGLLVAALVVAVPVASNYPVVDQSSDTSLTDYAVDLMKLAPPGSLLVTDDVTLWWGLVYRQRVESRDRDRTLLCTYPLRLRWYLPFLRREFPALAIPDGLEDELARGLAEVEAGDPTGQRSQALVERLTARIVGANLARCPVTVVIHQTSEELKAWGPFALQSLGIAYRVLPAPAPPAPYPTDYAPPERHNVRQVHGVDRLRVARRYSTALNRLGIIHIGTGQLAEAETAFKRALEYDPLYAQVLSNMGVLYAQHMQRPDEAYRVYRRFMDIAPDDRQAPAVARWLGEYQSRLVGR